MPENTALSCIDFQHRLPESCAAGVLPCDADAALERLKDVVVEAAKDDPTVFFTFRQLLDAHDIEVTYQGHFRWPERGNTEPSVQPESQTLSMVPPVPLRRGLRASVGCVVSGLRDLVVHLQRGWNGGCGDGIPVIRGKRTGVAASSSAWGWQWPVLQT